MTPLSWVLAGLSAVVVTGAAARLLRPRDPDRPPATDERPL
jgi:hypothetical protein